MQYNVEKFRALTEQKHGLLGALQKASERRRECHQVLRRLRGETTRWRNETGGPPPKALEVSIRETEAELADLTAAEERARHAFDEHGSIVTACETFLRERGIKVPTLFVGQTTDAGGFR